MTKPQLLFKWLYKEKTIIYKIYLLAILQGLMYLAIPLGIQGIVTFIMAGSFSASLILLSCITIVVIIFIGIFQLWQMRINETLHQKIFGDLVSKINGFIEKNEPSPQMLTKLNKFFEVVILQKGISKILLDFSFSIISIIFGLLLLSAYSTWFLIFTILLCATFYFIIRYYGKKGVETNVQTSNEKYKLIEWFQENSIGKQNQNVTDGTDINLKNYFTNRKNHYAILETQFKGIIIFKIVFIGLLLFFGAYLVQNGDLNIGQFISSEIIIFLVINSVEKLVGSLNIFYDIITALYKIESIFGGNKEFSILESKNGGLKSLSHIYVKPYSKKIKKSLAALFITGFIILLMPWTQNVSSDGNVSTLNPENRPQAITSRIAGRIEKWYIHEGDFVHKNDTIAFISEIKDDYVDPQLISRSESIIKAKETTIKSYEDKINAVDSQIDALNKSLLLKMAQGRNKIIQAKIKITTDSIEANTSTSNFKVAEEQLRRYEELMSKGVISKTELENRRVKVQDALASKASADNKYISSKNELLNYEIELNSIQQDFQEKLMKTESDKFSSLSLLYEGEGSLTKLQNQLANYSMRKGFYYVLAPQDGYIAKTNVQGIGEIVKEGAALCSIVPIQDEQAVELYVSPVDLPLIQKGQKVQLQFDGWPAFVFSGWPGISYGTYSAEIVAFDKVLSDNKKFRVLAKNVGEKWPEAIQIGGGVKGFALLKNVPLFYELWRIVNGFPPEFYKSDNSKKEETKK
ncbi:MAG: HlyD family efflux transporter periplasmic adaptor subunit [Bacteroidota bacterium]|nr:HlyD family efflux transporter periplasmic adaptor subunit [Bacteroidota bacterium]MDP3145539.1 HlyD family efflux transporter periplasmic adaptor subunit [Bacteroidota bacterium]MDP3557992.1 HlyD family efflux transporter periplasmic adaptor subunit [Bacteroidota bacterium]